MGVASEPRGRGITVTVKYGTGYDQPWVVFHGLVEEVRDDIVSFFGIQRENVVNLTLSDLVVNATSAAHGVGALASSLGATVIESRPHDPQVPADDAWVQASSSAPAEKEPAGQALLDRIGQAPDVPALQRLWVENQAAFADPAVMDAWKARGRALSQS